MSKEELSRIRSNSYSEEIIGLQKQGEIYFISKKWKDIERGKKSIRKQIDFMDIKTGGIIIRSPKVISTKKNKDGKYEAIMEYIHGHSGSEIAFNGNRERSMSLKEALSLILCRNLENSMIQEIPNKLLLAKVDEILAKENTNNEIREMIFALRKIIEKQISFKIPTGPCHGDLTFSNIIISETGSINLIDFIPSFIESPLWDIVKIYQDLNYGWSYRKESGALKVSAKIFFESCMPNLMNFFEQTWKYEILIFDLLNLIRLAPYIKDGETLEWLNFNLRNSLANLKAHY